MLDTVVMSGDDVCCSVVIGTLVGVFVFSVGGEGVKWMSEFGLGFTNPVGTGGVLDVCLCFGCGGVGGVGEECVGGLNQGRERWGGVMSV